MTVIDHFAVAGSNLEELSAWFADLTGVTPTPGGAHPGAGTRNALVSLGPRTYIELIAPDPEQPDPAQPRPFTVDELDPGGHALVTYAVAPTDIDDAVARLATDAGVDLGQVRAMSRQRPDGVELAWRLTKSIYPDGGGAIPFLIDWGDTPHPAADAAAGCSIASISFRHPEPARIQAVLDVLDLDVPVAADTHAGIDLRLTTPKGDVDLV